MQTIKTILPPATIGIIGGGQLGQMMAIEARYMGYKIVVLDPTPNCSVAQVADEQIVAQYDDMDAIQKLTDMSDVVTYEFENVDLTAAAYIAEKGKLPQGTRALEVTQNREKEKQVMRAAGLPVPAYTIVRTASECRDALQTFDFPCVIKTCRGGYDGKGQLKLESVADIEEAIQFTEKNKHCIIESWVSFDKEISVIFTRTQAGAIKTFPIAENEHKDHILYQTTVPALINETIKEKAIDAAGRLAEEIGVVGTFTIEMFVHGDDIYLNEMAPRPHNSGHYTIEACNMSQFGQHVRAICGLSLVDVELLKPSAMVNILGENLPHALDIMPTLAKGTVHLYGKDKAKPKRKMGHITFTADTPEEINELVTTYEGENA